MIYRLPLMSIPCAKNGHNNRPIHINLGVPSGTGLCNNIYIKLNELIFSNPIHIYNNIFYN